MIQKVGDLTNSKGRPRGIISSRFAIASWKVWQFSKVKREAVLTCLITASIIAGYFILDDLLQAVHLFSQRTFASIFIALVTIVTVVFARSTQRRARSFGICFANWKGCIARACLPTLLLITSVVLFKLVVLAVTPHSESAVFDLHDWGGVAGYSLPVMVGVVLGYAIMCFAQEFIVRGVLQSVLSRAANDVSSNASSFNRVWMPRLVANLAFAAVHMQISGYFAILVFSAGMVWSVMYDRDRSLIGVTFSHIIVGLFVFCVLGIDFLIP